MALRTSPGSLHRRIVAAVGRGIPRRTVRFRLTVLYGGLFLLLGAGLLGATYFMVTRATPGVVTSPGTAGSFGVTVSSGSGTKAPHASHHELRVVTAHAAGGGGGVAVRARGVKSLTPAQMRQQARTMLAQARTQHDREMHDLLLYAGVALAFMAVVAFGLGWFVAGRVLRPLRTMTATVREISASSLHERLSLTGPDDELKELGDTFDALLGRLEGSFRAQRQFVANASHELRTPLARQKVLSQVALADEEATVASLRAAHERVLASGEQQERLIEALLALSRGQAGTELRDRVDLAAVAQRVVLAREEEARARGLDVQRRARPATLTGDARLVERLVSNLVDNAVRYNVEGGMVVVATRVLADRAVLTVANTGPAVTGDDLDRMFQPFQRLGRERTGDGAGLGLSIVAAIADAHGAAIGVRPRPGGGIEVEVAFPAGGTGPEGGAAAEGADRREPSLAAR